MTEAPLSAFKSITIPVDLGTDVVEIKVPFTVELLEKVEDCLFAVQGVGLRWFRMKPSDKTVRDAYESFCKPFLPETLDLQKAQPTFCALFFSAVKNELLNSIHECESLMTFTIKPSKPTPTDQTKAPESPSE